MLNVFGILCSKPRSKNRVKRREIMPNTKKYKIKFAKQILFTIKKKIFSKTKQKNWEHVSFVLYQLLVVYLCHYCRLIFLAQKLKDVDTQRIPKKSKNFQKT